MNICFPVYKDLGLRSPVHQHFGAAPVIMIVDTDEGSMRSFYNRDLNHIHGQCDPLRALGGEPVDLIVTGSIGHGPLSRLQNAGIRVLKSEGPTVEDNIILFFDKGLPEFITGETCSEHEGGGNCCGR